MHGPCCRCQQRQRTGEVLRVDLAGHALIPDLHNCHLHSGPLRGTAEDLPMLDWLRRMRLTRCVPVKSIGLRNCC